MAAVAHVDTIRTGDHVRIGRLEAAATSHAHGSGERAIGAVPSGSTLAFHGVHVQHRNAKGGLLVKPFAFIALAVITLALAAPAAAQAPVRERTLACSDGTTFVGMHVRQGAGNPPAAWRNVVPGESPSAFVFHASFVTAPDGTVVEAVSYDHSQGTRHNRELVTCSFVIPIGIFEGYTADFVGFFVP